MDDHTYNLDLESKVCPVSQEEETRKFQIFFKINNHSPVKITNLNLREYLQFKTNDNYVLDYCKDHYLEEKENVETLHRSLDDVDYTIVYVKQSNVSKNDTDIMHQEIQPLQENNSNISQKEISQTQLDHVPSGSTTINRKMQASRIWDHVLKTNDKNTLQCKYGKKHIKVSGNTTNMIKHLCSQHSLFFNRQTTDYKANQFHKRPYHSDKTKANKNKDSPPGKKCSVSHNNNSSITASENIAQAFRRINSFKDGGYISDKISNAIFYMLCRDLLPASTVENEGFLTLLKVLVPLYKTPSRKTITRMLESKYIVLKESFILKLQKANFYCLTCDNWTDNTNQSYLGVTIHYLNTSLKFESKYIGCYPLFDRHTANYLKNSILKIFEDFQISIEKISAIITDGEAAIKKATIEIIGKEKHVVCVAHIAAKLLPDALKDFPTVKVIIDKIKALVTFIKRSIVASDKLKKLQIQDGKSESTVLKLIQDVPTRWASKFEMIQRYVQLESYIYLAIRDCDNSINVINRDELIIIKDLLPLMESVTIVIHEISGSNYSTCSLFIPIIRCLENNIEIIKPETEFGIQFKIKLQESINNRFQNLEYLLNFSVATILDPRFKKLHFKDSLAVSTAITFLKNKLSSRDPQLDNCFVQKVNDTSNTTSIWEFHDNICDENINNVEIEKGSLELEQYFQLPRIPRKNNIFSYWKNVEITFPLLSKFALRQLAILATSVSAERLFSRGGILKNDRRNRLTGGHLNILLFLSSLDLEDWNVF